MNNLELLEYDDFANKYNSTTNEHKIDEYEIETLIKRLETNDYDADCSDVPSNIGVLKLPSALLFGDDKDSDTAVVIVFCCNGKIYGTYAGTIANE